MTNNFIRYSLRRTSLTAGLTIACSALNAQATSAATTGADADPQHHGMKTNHGVKKRHVARTASATPEKPECLTENELSDFSGL
ncbi:hypothetical protein [Acetobacter fallax]|uniref:Uncharacterized protein n=1 Tax=Acetobacter fallax TaxID=1737473 RepID=A0ABX0KIS3_9PROT|nr:hypothetical protein [Acetobacter fallax]NHO34275.1 hypothetical protein [Acetobacter fallax]NHO37824.1 hypothetical protein [Acetobacter fallax]